MFDFILMILILGKKKFKLAANRTKQINVETKQLNAYKRRSYFVSNKHENLR